MRRSKLSLQVRREHFEETLALTPGERTELALELFRMAVEAMRRHQGVSRAEAIRRMIATRSAGRRPSKANMR